MEELNIQFVIDENGYKHYIEEVLGGGGQGVLLILFGNS